jgi:hypothetical protein
MTCHRAEKQSSPELAKVREAALGKKEIPWVRVYRNPDFVFFSHERHARARVECAECHGPVEKRDVLMKEVSTSMTACMSCHAARGARNDCSACHELGQ